MNLGSPGSRGSARVPCGSWLGPRSLHADCISAFSTDSAWEPAMRWPLAPVLPAGPARVPFLTQRQGGGHFHPPSQQPITRWPCLPCSPPGLSALDAQGPASTGQDTDRLVARVREFGKSCCAGCFPFSGLGPPPGCSSGVGTVGVGIRVLSPMGL